MIVSPAHEPILLVIGTVVVGVAVAHEDELFWHDQIISRGANNT